MNFFTTVSSLILIGKTFIECLKESKCAKKRLSAGPGHMPVPGDMPVAGPSSAPRLSVEHGPSLKRGFHKLMQHFKPKSGTRSILPASSNLTETSSTTA